MSSEGDVKEKLMAQLRELHLPTFRECFEEAGPASGAGDGSATSSTCWSWPSGNARTG